MAQVCPAPDTGRWIRTLLIPFATLVAGLASSGAYGGPTLGLADAERVAIQRDAVLAQLAAESAGMRQRAVAEGSLMDPRLRVGAVNVPVNDWSLTAEDMTMVEVGVSQEFPSGRTRSLAQKRMEQISTASQSAAQDRRRVVQREVRRVWVELAWIAAARELVDGQVQWVEQLRNSARARYASGEGRQIDLLQAGLDVAMLREQQLDLDREAAMRRAQLARWLGEDDAARAGPFALPARADPPPLATLEARLEAHPAQQDYVRRIEAAQTGVELAEQSTRPGWMLDLSYGFRGGEMDGKPRPDMVTAMVSVDLPFFRGSRTSAEVDAARAEADGLHEMHTDHQREMRGMLAEAWNTVERTGELERYYETDLLPLAEQTVQAALLAYRGNRAMFEEVVEARRVALETGLKHLRIAADRAQAQYEIDYLAGETP
ncbi:MAG: TolC family protein [Steroidobacteraceae bacterium]